MSTALKKMSYPHISSHQEIAGGEPVIEGTRITVRCIAGYYQMGMSVDEILTSLSHLKSSQVHSALAYYFDHQEEIDRDLEKSSDKEFWKRQVLSHPKKKA
jgi:uncharacterized protein (DUF433 family)